MTDFGKKIINGISCLHGLVFAALPFLLNKYIFFESPIVFSIILASCLMISLICFCVPSYLNNLKEEDFKKFKEYKRFRHNSKNESKSDTLTDFSDNPEYANAKKKNGSSPAPMILGTLIISIVCVVLLI